ncbi:hypothetical protein ACU5AX_09495 [Sphingomonas sp. XXL09]|uniref:hypothetical protein n=1 Tax=Sphingomonas sp. XXL09 TaxID=3457787 RepID=UPI00406BB670
MKSEFAPGEPCGCGSRQPYSRCCQTERVKYYRDGRGSVFKSISLNEAGVDAFKEASDRFREMFGRKPSKKDQILVDSYSYSPDDLYRDMMKAFREAGTPGHLAYAFSRTGLIVTEKNRDLASPIDLEEYEAAIDEYMLAYEAGIDLLEADGGPVAIRLSEFHDILNMIVIHLGSYAAKSPRETGKTQSTFFQYLLVGKVHQCAKALHRGWGTHLTTETFSLLRSVFECALLIRRLHEQKEFAKTLFAQALVGIGPFSYRLKKNGEIDRSKIFDSSSGEFFEARTSYFDCAKIASEDEAIFFEVIYPFLSSNIHFDGASFIKQYRDTGSFLIWEKGDSATQAIFILAVFSYFIISLRQIEAVPSLQKRDMQYLLGEIADCFYGLYIALDDEDTEIDEHTSLVFHSADRLFRGESLSEVKDQDSSV